MLSELELGMDYKPPYQGSTAEAQQAQQIASLWT